MRLNLKKLTKTIKKIYKKNTKLKNTKSKNDKLKKEDDISLNNILKRIYWDSDECLKFGLIDLVRE